MKQRRFAFVLGLALLAVLVAGCAGTTGSRGWAPPVRTDDELLVSTGWGRLDAIDTDTFEGRWRFPGFWDLSGAAGRLSGIYGPPVLSEDGRVVFVGDYNGYVYAFRPADLADATGDDKPPAAAFKLSDKIIGGLALDEATGALFVAAGKTLYALRADDLIARIGNSDASVGLSRVFRAGDEIWSTPVLSAGKVLVASLDGNLYAIDLRSGSVAWRFPVGKALASTPVVAGDVVLVGGFGGRLHAVDLASGSERWSFRAANWVWSRPLVAGERVYFGDFDGNLYAVNLASGALIWRVDLGRGAIRASPALAGGLLIVASEEGWLLGIDPASRAVRWEKDLDTSLNADLVVNGDDVLIAPGGCVTPAGATEKVYYASVDAATGELRGAAGVC